MADYEIKNMIIDDGFDSEEYVTADFSYDMKDYSITFKKADLEVLNTWVFEENSSFPANLSDEMVESIREDIKRRI
ncbi:hypothetical protein ACJ2A9_22815 [Anaerobacillus sp. MEB173]|uniref:hypothetical protein n=1 Tax=Anaerobacillus sp. MEB173 TaxID=3383345 RepID=UPI003F8F3A55